MSRRRRSEARVPERSRLRRLSTAVVAISLLGVPASPTASADHLPDDPGDGPYIDQRVDGVPPGPDDPAPEDPHCDRTQFPGTRSLIGTEQSQTFVPSRTNLSAIDLCLTSNVPNLQFNLTITGPDQDDPEWTGTATSQLGTRFLRVDFVGEGSSPAGLGAGVEYTLTLEGPDNVDLTAVLAWRLTCRPDVVSNRCGETTDRYRHGGASGLGENADFGFRTLTPETADLAATLTSAPRHVCRERVFPAQLEVSNAGQAQVRDFDVTVHLSADETPDPGDVLLAEERVTGTALGIGNTIVVPVDLVVPAGALGTFDGRARLLVAVDPTDAVVESRVVEENGGSAVVSGEGDNRSHVESVLTSCDPADIASLRLTASPTEAPAGVGEVDVSELPVGSIPFGATGLAATPLNANPLNANPLNANPLNANPLLHAPLNANPLNANPLNANPLNANPLNANSFLFGAPYRVLEQIPLTSVALLRPGGWQAVLDRHAEIVAATGAGSEPIDHVALQHLTLLDVMRLDPVPSPPMRWGELDLAASGLGALVLAAAATGATPLAEIALPGGQPWCAFLAEHGLDCAAHDLDEEAATLVTVNLLGLDMTTVPFGGITMDAVALHPDAPLALVALRHDDPTLEFDPRRTPWGGISVTTAFAPVIDCDAFPCEDGARTLGDAAEEDAFLEGSTVGQLLEVLSPAERSLATLSDLILGTIHHRASLPFEGLRLDPLRLSELVQDEPFVTYTLTVSAGPGGSSLVDPDLQAVLPPGFAYVPGSAELTTLDTAASVGEPEIEPGDRVELTWQPDLYVAAGTDSILTFQANPGRVLGNFTVVGEVSGTDLSPAGTYHATTGEAAPVTVVERFEPNDPDAGDTAWREVPADTLVFSHISQPGDLDVWRIPVPEEPHARVKIVLSHLPEDYDLLLGGATANPLHANPLHANPLNANPLNANPLNANRVIPEDGAQWQANTTDRTTPPETLQDLPLNANPLNANGVRAVSIERGTTHETIVIETVDGEGGYFPLVVSGYNGASSDEPYVLRHHVIAPHRIDLGACRPKPFPTGTGAAGALPDPETVDDETNTLFLVARQRMTDRFGAADRDALLAKIAQVADRPDLGVRGLVVPIEGAHWGGGRTNPVATAYAQWDDARCDPVTANTVAGTIRDLVLDYRAHAPIRYVVVLGDDDQIPFLRVRDGSVLANEVGFVSTAVADLGDPDSDADNTPLTAALQAGLFLTDDHLGTAQARPWLDHAVWLPDVATGRLTGDVDTMVAALDRFLGSDGRVDPHVLRPTASAVAGYDHLSDGATLVADRLDARLEPTASTLIGETWARDQLDELLTFGPTDRDVVASVNGHADHRRFLPALGNLTGSIDHLYEAGDLAAFPPGSLLFSMACHLGYDLPTGAPGTIRDWADDVMARQGVLIANSGFNYGDTETVAAGELYAALFAERLDGELTVGEVNALTKAEVYAREGAYGAEFLKSMQGMVLFGLPFYRIAGTADTQQPSSPLPSVIHDPTTGLEVADLTIDLPLVPSAADCPAGSSCLVAETTERGVVHRVVGALGYHPLAVSGRPTGPRAVIDVTDLVADGRRVHGAVLLGLESVDIPDVDPVFARSIVDRADREPEPQALGTIFPTAPLRVATVDTPLGERQVLTLQPWTLRTDRTVGGTVVGDLRLDTSLTVRLYLSSSGDNLPPTIGDVEARRQGEGVTFRVTTATTNAPLVAVLATYRDHLGGWHTTRLTSADGLGWFGVGPLPGLDDAPIDVLVQAVDQDGDVGHWRHKGERLPLAHAGQLAFELGGTTGDNGWFRSAVTVSLDPDGGPYERRIDGGPWEPTTGPTFDVAGDGVHRVDVRAADGAESREIVIAIDTTAPTVEIRSPADGSTHRTGDLLQVDFDCSDDTSGLAGCEGTHPDGTTVTLSSGEGQVFTVAARDRAGNAETATSRYDVFDPPMEFRGFHSPVANGVFNTVAQTTDTVPFKWRLYRGGVLVEDVSAVRSLSWHQVSCAQTVDGAADQGTVTPATSSNGQGVMLVSGRMQYEAAVAASFRGTCQRFDLRLADGQTASAWFRFAPA